MFFDQEKMKGGKALLDIIALITELVEKIYREREKFIEDPAGFSDFETRVHKSFVEGARQFLVATLEDLDDEISKDSYRQIHYNVQRHDNRTIITTVGDVTFNRRLYRERKSGKYRHLLDEVMKLEPHERFSEAAEAAMLGEAVKTSYHEASYVVPTESGITKTTVMNKVHGLMEWIPEKDRGEKKKAEYLLIDADEDHIAEQHGRGSKKENSSFMSRLLYVYEGKSSECAGRKQLDGIHYIGGLYSGSEGIKTMWEETWEYIRKNYDTTKLEKIYVCGDGAQWIKKCTEWLPLSEFVLDRYHLMKYIYDATGWMIDSKEEARSELYRMIIGNRKQEFTDYTLLMAKTAPTAETVETMQTYILNNWEAIQASYHDGNCEGCSAEGHVSHVFSDRMSSRPMGWSQEGADSMSRLRCYVKNNGSEKIIDLVKYNRKKRREKLAKTGTDDAEVFRKGIKIDHGTEDRYDIDASYIERIQASIPGIEAIKTFSIRNQLHLL